jgi:flagellar biosynthesis GTPase FlhF
LKKQGQSQRSGGAARPGTGGRGTSNMPSLDELAARRRQQLQELARQRRASTGSASSSPPLPSAQSRAARPRASAPAEFPGQRAQTDRMAALEERRRAQQEAQRRAEPVHQARAQQQRQMQAAQVQQAAKAQLRTRETAMRRRQELAEQALRQQARRSAAPPPPPRRAAVPPHLAGLGAGVTEVDLGPVHEDLDVGESVVHRHVTDVAPPPPHFTRAHFMNMNRNTLRAAILFKEILDKPVGMRDQDPGPQW